MVCKTVFCTSWFECSFCWIKNDGSIIRWINIISKGSFCLVQFFITNPWCCLIHDYIEFLIKDKRFHFYLRVLVITHFGYLININTNALLLSWCKNTSASISTNFSQVGVHEAFILFQYFACWKQECQCLQHIKLNSLLIYDSTTTVRYFL